MEKRLTNEEFTYKANKIHKNKYDYSKVNYRGMKGRIIIICPIHKEFSIKVTDHIYRHKGCAKCIEKEKTVKFIEKARKIHGDKYDYSQVNYKIATKKIKIFCKEHKDFIYQLPHNHLNGGCKKCAIMNLGKKRRLTKKEFIKKAKEAHGDRYDYSKVKYVNSRSGVVVICRTHGEFDQLSNNHLKGLGCPDCKHKNQGKVKEFLIKHFKDWIIISNKKIWDKYGECGHRRHCDFWLEKNGIKIMIEYDGQQHFRPVSFGCRDSVKVANKFKHTQLKDKLDAKFCKENNIILHRIRYDEDKEESIISLRNKL